METLKGEMLLKIVGIVCLIGGAGSGIFAVIGLIGGKFTNSMLIMAFVFTVFFAIANVLGGICAYRNCKNPGAADLCFKYGLILFVFYLGSLAFSVLTKSFALNYVMSMLLPILYIVGARLNKAS
ncbi:MAG: hypothetical protein RSD88_07785 [Anaerovoracaceae bacterium]